MATNRQYEAATIFNARCADMRHLWTPSTEFQGKPTQKPNYFSVFIVQKTQGHWSQEPVFGGVMTAINKLLAGQLQAFAQNVGAVQWPIMDGDMPSPQGKVSEFAKGHWIFSASSGNPPSVELVQSGGQLVKLQNRVGVKSGDYCTLGVTAAVKANQANGVKFYLNAVVFTAPGEEIVFANSVSGAELMAHAQQQGIQITGFAPSAGGFSQPGPTAPPMGGGFPGSGGGFAPTPANPAPVQPASAPNFGGAAGSAFPSNPGPNGLGGGFPGR